ncbi:MAG: hypothetical protein ACYDBR_05850 [Gaiellaceae bacterium]
MTKRKLLRYAALASAFVLVGAGSFLLGDEHAADRLGIDRVGPDQIAAAMAGDHFYSDYRERTLVVVGTVASVARNRGGGASVTFETRSSFGVLCTFATYPSGLHGGDRVTVLSEGGRAERRGQAVVLQGCIRP